VLLLVLILVLIAFSLLVVALLTGSVLWAWVSVGVSVAAALVLLIDFLQRRSAVRAGTEAGAAAGALRTGSLEPEAVTEVLPVLPRSSSATADNSGNGSRQDASTELSRQGADDQQTVVMPVVQPSASADRPSGASHGTTPSSGESSPTVTTARADRSPSAPPSGEVSTGGTAPDGGSAAVPDKSAEGEQPGVASSGAAASGAGKPGAGDSAGATVVVQGTGTTGGAAPAQQAAVEGGSAGIPPGAGIADPAPPAADGEPPEEPRDPAAVAIVAGLETEVLVIDEQPRYHVTGCRALVGKPLIPLPAREAVDLGFTPCGWCTPDRTLATQHATAR
jgi:hypothetical protein